MNRIARALALLSLACLLPLPRTVSADPPVAENAWVTCKPVETMIYLGARFHVKCDKGWTNPSTGHEYPYLAISASNSSQVEQAMSMAQTAQISGKRVRMLIKTSASSNPSGCQTDDCRAFISIGVVN
jgi:hypothetical protein